MDDMKPVPSPDQLPVPVKMTGIGNSHIAIKASAEAQAVVRSGVEPAARFLGLRIGQGVRAGHPHRSQLRHVLLGAGAGRGVARRRREDLCQRRRSHQAVRLEGKASKTDRLYIEAAVAELQRRGRRPLSVHRALSQAGEEGAARHRGAHLSRQREWDDGFDDNGEPKPGEKEKIAILEGVLKDAPNDSAANHYWIHAMEPSNHPERAIPSAALLASLAPTSGHMVHMPGHIYYRVGDYASADRWFTASTEADERYMREQHVSVDDDWNYVHNLMYGIANLMEQGRLECRERSFRPPGRRARTAL